MNNFIDNSTSGGSISSLCTWAVGNKFSTGGATTGGQYQFDNVGPDAAGDSPFLGTDVQFVGGEGPASRHCIRWRGDGIDDPELCWDPAGTNGDDFEWNNSPSKMEFGDGNDWSSTEWDFNTSQGTLEFKADGASDSFTFDTNDDGTDDWRVGRFDYVRYHASGGLTTSTGDPWALGADQHYVFEVGFPQAIKFNTVRLRIRTAFPGPSSCSFTLYGYPDALGIAQKIVSAANLTDWDNTGVKAIIVTPTRVPNGVYYASLGCDDNGSGQIVRAQLMGNEGVRSGRFVHGHTLGETPDASIDINAQTIDDFWMPWVVFENTADETKTE